MYDIIQTKLTVLANLLESHMWETIPCAKNETAQETTDLVTFTEEILNGKLHFLCSVMNCWIKMILCKIFKSSHQRCSVRKDILSDFAKFKGKHLCQSLRPAAEACNFIIKETLAQVFSYVSFAKFLRMPFLQNSSGRLLPDVLLSEEFQQSRWLLKSAKTSIIDQHLFLEDYINFRAQSEP